MKKQNVYIFEDPNEPKAVEKLLQRLIVEKLLRTQNDFSR